MCRVTLHSVLLLWQVMLPSGDVIYLLAVRPAGSSVIKCDKRVADSLISVLRQGTAKLTKDTAKTQSNLYFSAGWSNVSLSARVRFCLVIW